MRFMVLFKATTDYEAGILPDSGRLTDLVKFNEKLTRAGVLVGVDALHPSSKGTRVRFSKGKQITKDGPFAETKELIAGYWLWQVKSKEEALDWLRRSPLDDTEVELRQVMEPEDFGPSLPSGLKPHE